MSKLPLIVLLAFIGAAAPSKAENSFRFHLKHEPMTLDPIQVTPGEHTYLVANLYRGLIRYTKDELVFDLAERCHYKNPALVNCKIRKNAKWSDGSPITAQDFVDSFRRTIEPASKSPHSYLLFNVKNGKAIYEGKLSSKELGIKAVSGNELEFELSQPDFEFLEKLSNPLFVAYKPVGDALTKAVTSGPYKIKEWSKGKKIVLEPNYNYWTGHNPRPPVEIVFAEEDSTALTLYEKGVINFLWRVVAINIPAYKGRPDFIQIPVARYDYIGFNLRPGSPFEKKEVRKAFATSLNFEDFKSIFHALGAPGCPGISESMLPPEGHCTQLDPNQKLLSFSKPIKFYFSQLGGDDIKRTAEWVQEEWRKHLGVKVEIRGLEQKHYLTTLKSNPPDSFRVGVGLNRPTCLAALERFQTGHPENYVGFSNLRFDNLVKALSERKLNYTERKSICAVAHDILFKEEFIGIPTGRIHFTMLARPELKGWKLNELNQLDLADLYIEKGGGQ